MFSKIWTRTTKPFPIKIEFECIPRYRELYSNMPIIIQFHSHRTIDMGSSIQKNNRSETIRPRHCFVETGKSNASRKYIFEICFSNGQHNTEPVHWYGHIGLTLLMYLIEKFRTSFFIDQNQGLATFGIHFLSLKGTKLVDESLSASIVLCDVQLDDTRPDRQNHLTKYALNIHRYCWLRTLRIMFPPHLFDRYMKKRQTANHSHDDTSKPDTSMVDIVVRITQNEMFGKMINQNCPDVGIVWNFWILSLPVNLKVSSFDLILCLEYLMKILQFVSVPEDESAPKPIASGPTTTVPTTAVSKSKFWIFRLCFLVWNSLITEAVADVPAAPSKQMTVLLRVDQPDIILVEKLDDINCLALILNVSRCDRTTHSFIAKHENFPSRLKLNCDFASKTTNKISRVTYPIWNSTSVNLIRPDVRPPNTSFCSHVRLLCMEIHQRQEEWTLA